MAGLTNSEYDRGESRRRRESRGSLYPSGARGHERERDRDRERERIASRARTYALSDTSEDDDRTFTESSTRPRTNFERTPLSDIASSEASGHARGELNDYELSYGQPTRRARPPSALRRPSGTGDPRPELTSTTQATRQVPPASFTENTICSEFLNIALNDFDACASFVDQNRSILREDPNSIIDIAAKAFSRGDVELGKRGLQCALILQLFKGAHEDDVSSFILELDNPHNKYRRVFIDNYSRQKEYYLTKYRAPTEPARRTTQSRRPSGYALAANPLHAGSYHEDSGLSERMDEVRLQDTRPSTQYRVMPGHTHNQDQPNTSMYKPPMSRRESQTQHETPYARDMQTGLRGRTIPENPLATRNTGQSTYNRSSLAKNYIVRDSSFFKPGRVFKVLWHAPAGSDRAGSTNPAETSAGKFGEHVYSQLRWMMVIKKRPGYSLCCPISTYSGFGLLKKSFSESEVNAHAIVFAEGSSPISSTGEPIMKFDPIPIRIVDEHQQIDAASRIHLGKIHTVEHNVKVADIGTVSTKQHLNRVLTYVGDCFLNSKD